MTESKIINPLAWKLLGTTQGQTELDLPDVYNELYAAGSVNVDFTYMRCVTIIKPSVDAKSSSKTTQEYYSGFYNQNGSGTVCVRLNPSTKKIWLHSMTDGSSNITNTAYLKVFYR